MIQLRNKEIAKIIITLLCFVILLSPVISQTLAERTIDEVSKNNLTTINYDISSVAVSYVEEQFGDQFLFWVNIPDLIQMRATLLAVGNWSYVYIANETILLLGESNAISKCESIRDEFDSIIYPKAIDVAGSPDGNLGDVDGDPHVTIFLAPFCRHFGDNSVLGYYDDKDDDPYNPYSNLREMIYVESERPTTETYSIITHEFNHMIWGNYEYDEAEFLIEGLANHAVKYNEYNWWVVNAITTTYTYHPEISLLYFIREYGELWDSSYGQAFLFVTYLADRFGNAFTKELVSIDEDGAKAVDEALSRFGHDLTFNDVYLDWVTACILDDTSIYDGIYGFESVNYKTQTQTGIGLFSNSVSKSNVTHFYYGFDVKTVYYSGDNFTFIIDNPYPYALGISIIVKDDYGWNVTQIFNTERSDQINLYVEGSNIQQAYVITSLMLPETPDDFGIVYSLSELQREMLDYTFYKGKYEPTESSDFIIFAFITSIFLTVILRRKQNVKGKESNK